MIDESVVRKFWSRVNKNGPVHPMCGQCWVWTGTLYSNGYGRLYGFGRAHRLSWRIHFGEIPEGLLVCHHCDNKTCVNPDHLFTGTHLANMQDGVSKSRFALGDHNGSRMCEMPYGENHPNVKLSDLEVCLIRKLFVKYSRSFGGAALAKRFKSSPSQILGIAAGIRRQKSC